MDDEFDIMYDKEKDTITIGNSEFSCDFFRTLNQWKLNGINLMSFNVQVNPNITTLNYNLYIAGRTEIRISIEACAKKG